jgi:hypothetical protein
MKTTSSEYNMFETDKALEKIERNAFHVVILQK